MILRVHATKWKDPRTRARLLAYARVRAVETGRPSRIKVKDRWFVTTKVVVFPLVKQ